VFPCLSRSKIIRVIKINGNEMGRACGTHGGEGKCMIGFGGDTRKKETALKTRRSWENGIRRAFIIARSCNRCWHGKVIKITYFECVSVAVVIQHAKLSSLACVAVPYLSTLSHKRHDLKKRNHWTNFVCLIFSTAFVWNISHSQNNSATCYHKCTQVSTWNTVIVFRFL